MDNFCADQIPQSHCGRYGQPQLAPLDALDGYGINQ